MEVGFVKKINNFLIHLDGLPSARINDLVENEAGVKGLVSALLADLVEVWLLDEGNVFPGQMFKNTNKKLTLPVGPFLIGRVINPLGIPLDNQKPLGRIAPANLRELDKIAPGLNCRRFINRQFETGISFVDTLIPIGRGQRELVIGDARSGKMDFLTDVIVNQRYSKTFCVYAAIGKPFPEIRSLIDTLRANQALNNTLIVATASSDPAPLIFLTPKAAFTVAEYFQSQGKDVLIILDDMGNHAKIYREMSLLGNRAPGRESYPGDIFYQHSSLLERAGNFNQRAGGGSITALPVIELNLIDFTTFIPTNLMSMTDGHLLFRSSFYLQGLHPAIDISLSVSRVGQQTQERILADLATVIKQALAQVKQMETLTSFAFELPYSTQLILHQKEIIEEILNQEPLSYIPKSLQAILLSLPFTSIFKDKNKQFVAGSKKTIIQAFTEDESLKAFAQATLGLKNVPQLITKLENDPAMRRLDQILAGAVIKKKGQATSR